MNDVFSVILEHLETALDYGNMMAASFFQRGAETLHIYFNSSGLFQNSLVSWTYCFILLCLKIELFLRLSYI